MWAALVYLPKLLAELRQQGHVDEDLYLEIHARAAAVGVDLDVAIEVAREAVLPISPAIPRAAEPAGKKPE